MVMASGKQLFIQLDIPNSPFLLSLPSDANSDTLLLSATASAQPVTPCSILSHKMTLFSKMIPSISTSSSSSLIHHHDSLHSVPEITITYAHSQPSLNGSSTSSPPYTSPPRLKPRLSASASKKLNEYVSFLEMVDRDMASEVEHVKQSIKEAREYASEWREERSARCAELLKRRERQGRGSKEPENDI